MSPVISVIIPIYNAENRLNNIFSQLSKQNLENKYFEVIFINDGSEDSSKKIISDYILNRVNYHLLNQENKKQAEARNNGIRNAKGEYLLFIDDDDELENDYLKTFFEFSNGYDIVFSGIKKKFPNGKQVKENTIQHGLGLFNKSESLNWFLVKGKESDNGVWAKMYRKEFIIKNCIFFDNENFFEDSLFNFKSILSAELSKIKVIDYFGYKLIKHPDTTTNSFHPELDFLVDSYINKIKKILGIHHIKNIDIESFENREYIYLMHHHIKFDSYVNSRKVSKKIRKRRSLNSILPFKYKALILMISLSFSAYYFIYKHWNLFLFKGE